MVTPTTHVIPWPDLRCAMPVVLWGFSQDFRAKYK